MAMTESAIDVTPFRDIYIALGEPLDANLGQCVFILSLLCDGSGAVVFLILLVECWH